MNVLLIDDHEIVWDGTHRLLERLVAELRPPRAFSFRAVRDVAAACALPSQGFDLVLLDYHLPGVAGLAALQAVKQHFEATPVCMQSAEAAPQRVRVSPRQRQVLALAVRGVPIKLISRELGIAEGTVKVHLSMVYRALGARNRTDALCRLFDAQAAGALAAP
jgi:DNA-binding NarL/FixJ family response regulator